ncbi:hypothetical protein PLESTF_001550800 [Pleodorina starrii]|nr:hypothetical protein PLESTF_001550800 [Pleodorina starrii]
MAGAAMGHPHMHMPTAMVASTSNPLLNAASMPTASTPPLPSMQSQQQQQQQLAPGGLRPQAPGGLLAQAPGAMMTQLPMAGVAAPGLGPVGAAVATSYNVAGPSAGAGPSKPVMVNAVPGMMPYQGMYWLPPQMMDSTQDSLLRPPAA